MAIFIDLKVAKNGKWTYLEPMPHDVTWHHAIPHDVTWHHAMSHDVTWHQQCHMMSHDTSNATWCHMTPCNVTWCHMTPCNATWCHMTPCNATWCHMTPAMSHDVTWHHMATWWLSPLCNTLFSETWFQGEGVCNWTHHALWKVGAWFPAKYKK